MKWKQGCFAQDAVGDWWLCLPVDVSIEQTVAPKESIGIDLGIKDAAVTSDGERLEAGRFYRDAQRRLGALTGPSGLRHLVVGDGSVQTVVSRTTGT